MRAKEFTVKQFTVEPDLSIATVGSKIKQESSEGDNVGIFIPPLQQQLELLKKGAGVDSIYDTEDPQNKSEDMPNKSNNYETNPRVLARQQKRQKK